MTDWYFYQDQGKTVGPFKADDLREQIKQGRLRVFDLVYKDGENNWRMALEHSALRSEFKASTLQTLRERPWVCLQRRSKDDFVTVGPFTQSDMHEKLLAGEISYSDYAWKDGFHEWKRIGALEEFNPRARTNSLPAVPPVAQESAADLLKNVVELRRPTRATEPAKPAEAGDEITWVPQQNSMSSDTAPGVPPPLPVHAQSHASTPPPMPAVTPAPRAATVAPPVQSRPVTVAPAAVKPPAPEELEPEVESRPLFDWGLVAVLALILIGTVLIISRFVQLRPTSEPVVVSEPPANFEPPPAPVAPPLRAEVTPSRSEAEPVKSVSRPPKEILLSVQTVNNLAHIDLRCDASPDFAVNVQIIGFAGQVTEGPGFYRFMRMNSTGSLGQPIDLSGLKLPEGHFVVRADSGTVKKEVKFSWGLNDPQYKTTIAHQRKLWSGSLWRERLTLFRLSEALSKALSAAGGGKFSGRGFESVLTLKRTNPSSYVLFDDWWELHDIATAAKDEGVTPGLVARTEKEQEHLSAFTVWK